MEQSINSQRHEFIFTYATAKVRCVACKRAKTRCRDRGRGAAFCTLKCWRTFWMARNEDPSCAPTLDDPERRLPAKLAWDRPVQATNVPH